MVDEELLWVARWRFLALLEASLSPKSLYSLGGEEAPSGTASADTVRAEDEIGRGRGRNE